METMLKKAGKKRPLADVKRRKEKESYQSESKGKNVPHGMNKQTNPSSQSYTPIRHHPIIQS